MCIVSEFFSSDPSNGFFFSNFQGRGLSTSGHFCLTVFFFLHIFIFQYWIRISSGLLIYSPIVHSTQGRSLAQWNSTFYLYSLFFYIIMRFLLSFFFSFSFFFLLHPGTFSYLYERNRIKETKKFMNFFRNTFAISSVVMPDYFLPGYSGDEILSLKLICMEKWQVSREEEEEEEKYICICRRRGRRYEN